MSTLLRICFTLAAQLFFEQNYQNTARTSSHFDCFIYRMFQDLLNEPLVFAVLGLLLGFALVLFYSNCFAQPRGEQRPRPQRAARGELKMVLLVRTDLGMQKGTFCSKMFLILTANYTKCLTCLQFSFAIKEILEDTNRQIQAVAINRRPNTWVSGSRHVCYPFAIESIGEMQHEDMNIEKQMHSVHVRM